MPIVMCVTKIYEKKTRISTNISIFSEALSMCNQITNKNTDNPAT